MCGPPSAGSDFAQFESLHSGGGRTYLNHDSVGKDEWDAPPPPPPPPPTVATSESNQSSSQIEPWELDRKDNTIDDELVRFPYCEVMPELEQKSWWEGKSKVVKKLKLIVNLVVYGCLFIFS